MKKTIGSDFFKEYVNVGDLKPNGSGLFSYVRYDTDVENDKYISNLYLYDMANDTSVQLTDEGTVGMHDWLDECNIVISTLRSSEDKELSEKGVPLCVFHKLNIKTKEYTELFKVFRSVYKFQIIDENRFLLLSDDHISDDEIRKVAGKDWNKYVSLAKKEEDYFIAEEVPFWTNDGGYSNGERCRAYLYDNGEMTLLSPGDISVTDIKTYNDKYGCFYGVETGGVQKTTGKLYKIDYSTGNVEAIDESNTYIYTKIQPLDEHRLLVCRSDRSIHGEYQNEYIDIIDLKSGQYTRNNKKADIHLYDNVINDVTYLTGWLNKITVLDDGMVFISTRGGSSQLLYWPIGTDDFKVITDEEGKIIDYFVEDKKIYMIAMRDLGGPELYVKDLLTGEERCLTAWNTRILTEFQISEVEACNFVDSDGVEIEGWVMKPTNYVAGKKYPAVLFIHGGPESAYGPVMTHEMQVMCTEGFGVIYCNPRGSEGRGGEFGDIRTKWGTIDYRDLMEFTDAAIENCVWIDSERLAVTGGSYGGIMTNWIIGHTNRYKAAISDRSVCNLFSDYNLSDIGFPCNMDTYGTTPWDNPELMWEQSALKYAPKIKTPVLFIHGVDDYRCPFVHSLELHTAITYFGGTSKVFGVKGETHELCRSGSPSHRIRRIEEMVKWLKKYLV